MSKIDFIELDSISGYTRFSSSVYLNEHVVACLHAGGVGAYKYTDTGTLELKSVVDDGGGGDDEATDICTDGTYIYVTYKDQLAVYSLNSNTGELILLDSEYDAVTLPYSSVYYSDGYIIVCALADGMFIYSFDGTNLTLEDSDDQGNSYRNAIYDGTYIYAARGNGGLSLYTWDGVTLTHRDNEFRYADCEGVAFNNSDKDYVMASTPARIHAYTAVGNSLSYITSLEDATLGGMVFNTGDTFFATHTTNVQMYSYSGGVFTQYGTYTNGSNIEYRVSNISSNSNVVTIASFTGDVAELCLIYMDDADTCGCEVFNIIGGGTLIRLHKPDWDGEEKSISKDIAIFDFWDDTFETVDKGLNTEPLRLTGIEYVCGMNEGVCFPFCFPFCFSGKLSSKFAELDTLANNDSVVRIEELGDCMDGYYIIRNFHYDTIPKTPGAYKWSLELEWKKALEV